MTMLLMMLLMMTAVNAATIILTSGLLRVSMQTETAEMGLPIRGVSLGRVWDFVKT